VRWCGNIHVISKSNKCAARVWFEITTTILVQNCTTEVQLPIYFDIAKITSLNTRTTRFWSVPLFVDPVAGLPKSRTVNVMSTSCDCIMWLVVLFYCLILIGWEKKCDLEQKYCDLWINRTTESQSDCKDRTTSDFKMDLINNYTNKWAE